jgi:predicted transcriptional regulator
MDVKEKKLDLIDWLVNLTDETIIEKVYDFKKTASQDWDEELSKEEKLGIERGLEDFEEGRVSTHEQVTERIKSKFPFLK